MAAVFPQVSCLSSSNCSGEAATRDTTKHKARGVGEDWNSINVVEEGMRATSCLATLWSVSGHQVRSKSNIQGEKSHVIHGEIVCSEP